MYAKRKVVSVSWLIMSPEIPKEQKSLLMFKECTETFDRYFGGVVDAPNLDTKTRRVYKINNDLWGCPVVVSSDGWGSSLLEKEPRLKICSTFEAFSVVWGLTEEGTCYRPQEVIEVLKDKYPLLAKDIKDQEDKTIYRA